MKSVITLTVLLSLSAAAFSQADASRPAMAFADTTFHFGQIPQGTPVTHIYRFTNTGTAPLIISNVQVQCGCTSPEWTKSPVLPGETGYVAAQFNAAAMGHFSKFVTVISNATKTQQKLYFSGEVVTKTTPIVDPNGATPVLPVEPNQ
jgi:hypothetical protein